MLRTAVSIAGGGEAGDVQIALYAGRERVRVPPAAGHLEQVVRGDGERVEVPREVLGRREAARTAVRAGVRAETQVVLVGDPGRVPWRVRGR